MERPGLDVTAVGIGRGARTSGFRVEAPDPETIGASSSLSWPCLPPVVGSGDALRVFGSGPPFTNPRLARIRRRRSLAASSAALVAASPMLTLAEQKHACHEDQSVNKTRTMIM